MSAPPPPQNEVLAWDLGAYPSSEKLRPFRLHFRPILTNRVDNEALQLVIILQLALFFRVVPQSKSWAVVRHTLVSQSIKFRCQALRHSGDTEHIVHDLDHHKKFNRMRL